MKTHGLNSGKAKFLVAATAALCCGLAASTQAALVQDDYQADSTGALTSGSSGARYVRLSASEAAIVGAATTPQDPFGSPGNQSLMISDTGGASGSSSTVGYAFSSTSAATTSVKLFVEDSTDYSTAYGYVRLGSNSDPANTPNGAANLGPWLLIDGRFAKPNLQVLTSNNGDGTGGTKFTVTDAALAFNTVQTLSVDFDSASDTYTLTLDGQPVSAGGNSVFSFYTPQSDINDLEMVAGGSSRPHSRLYFDDMLVQVPEPASLALLGLGALPVLIRRRRA